MKTNMSVETTTENRREFLEDQIRGLWAQLAGPPCNQSDERRQELEYRVLLLTAELHGLKPPPPTPIGAPDDD